MARTIAVLTTSRADYSHLYWPLRDLASDPAINLRLIVMGPHLSPEFGNTVREIEQDGFSIHSRIECLLSSDSDVGMAKTIGVATLGLADCLAQVRPDLLLIIADRFEMLAPATVAVALRIPVAHIEGGEISEGAIDNSIRNALTMLSHVHFTSTESARARVIAFGEEAWRVHKVGSPSLDHLRRSRLKSREELETELQLDLQTPFALIGFHPATIARDTTREAAALFEALSSASPRLFFCYPNADAGSRELIQRTRAFCETRPDSKILVNLDPVTYWSLLGNALLLIGNSSSGIMEAASFATPVVNIGIRQQGRERGANVLDAPADAQAIIQNINIASSQEFRSGLVGMQNPYGDGYSSERIARVLGAVPLGESLLMKKSVT
jgi:UDP-N-acetylglucosamine 2-epimerase (non-hydrolysing)/GDP/UDP-N,N'-diacetylbacillosamine 2-epimerase (hydrolysing)